MIASVEAFSVTEPENLEEAEKFVEAILAKGSLNGERPLTKEEKDTLKAAKEARIDEIAESLYSTLDERMLFLTKVAERSAFRAKFSAFHIVGDSESYTEAAGRGYGHTCEGELHPH